MGHTDDAVRQSEALVLFDNDRIAADLGEHLTQEFGDENRDRLLRISPYVFL